MRVPKREDMLDAARPSADTVPEKGPEANTDWSARAVKYFLPGMLVALFAFPVAADDKWITPGTHERTMINDMVERTFLVHVPKGFTPGKPVPLVVVLHGMHMTGQQMELLTRFSLLGDQKGFAVAYPDAFQGMWDYYRKQGEPWVLKATGGGLDLDFLPALIDEMIAVGLADPTRVYMTGVSNGGFMTNRMALDIPGRLAATASVCGTLSGGRNSLKANGPIPILHIHGTADIFVGYGTLDGRVIPTRDCGAEGLVEFWAEKNGCNAKPDVETVLEKANDGTKVERVTYSGGRDGTEVILYRIRGGGHTWPGIPNVMDGLTGKTTQNLDATEVIWEFFSRFTRKHEKK